MLAERAVRRRTITVVVVVFATTAGGFGLLAVAGRLGGRVGTPIELALALALMGSLIGWQRPSNRIGALLGATGVLFGVSVFAGGVLGYASTHAGVPSALRQAALAVAWLTQALALPWALFLLWFPDGHFLAHAWKRFFVAGAVVNLALAFVGYLLSTAGGRLPALFAVARAPTDTGGPLATVGSTPVVYLSDALSLAMPLVSLAALAQRYQRSGVIVRQEIKWLVAGAMATIVGSAIAVAIQDLGGAGHAVGVAIDIIVNPLPLAAATVAILRYRLWEIDVVVSRALVYAVLWAALSVVVLLPALTTGLLVGGPGALAAVGLALLVTLVFQPARARLERIAERVVYRHRPRGYALLTGFGETLRAALGVEDVAPHLAEVVRSGLGTSWAGVWIHVGADGGGALRSVASVGVEPGPSVLLTPRTSLRLRNDPAGALTGGLPAELPMLWPGTAAAAVVPLVAGEELVGLLACGQRGGDPLAEPDIELLRLIGREAALALRNLQLETQLRQRLTQIEQQAEALRRSRQRLVGVQDEQRRRIERDLHDGVQQQLVALTTQLRRASIATPADAHRLLERLAGDAEEAVFALQELARGIFPSLLADQGLVAALRTQAARMPISIHIEAEPNLANHRFKPDLEAALYFVALEALANVQKHAAGAAAIVTLRRAQGNGCVVLEIHDDGPGFQQRAQSPGTGLQNMHDRVAAIGGELRVDSRVGAGTWLHAEVPIKTVVVDLQHDADSRR